MAEVFDIGHESDLSEYTSTVTDGGDLSQGTPGLAGTSGRMECLLDDTTAIYGEKEFTQLTSTSYRFRFYLDINSLTMGSANQFYVCQLLDNGSNRARVALGYDGSNYEIKAGVDDDSSTEQDTAFYDVTDEPHYIEVLITYASSDVASDGTLDLWIDGVSQEQVTGIDLYDFSKPDEARLGAVSGIDAATSGTFYLDEFILRDDDTEIGPVSTTTAQERASVATLATVWNPPSVIPDGTLALADRQQIAWSYAGIEAQSVGGTIIPVIMHHRQQQGMS